MRLYNYLLLMIGSLLLMVGVSFSIQTIGDAQSKPRRQEDLFKPENAKPCNIGPKVFAVEPELAEAKVEELGRLGYCLERSHMMAVGNKLVIIVTNRDLNMSGEDCGECPECCER